MAKRTYVALSKIIGLEPPKRDRDGNVVGEHTLEIGAECTIDEALAQPLVAGGSLALKGAAVDEDLDADKGKGGEVDKGKGK